MCRICRIRYAQEEGLCRTCSRNRVEARPVFAADETNEKPSVIVDRGVELVSIWNGKEPILAAVQRHRS